MNKIFIEAKKETTSECYFLKAILAKYFPDKDVVFVCMDGAGNLFNETNVNQILQTKEDGDNVIVLLDADTVDKGAGFVFRRNEVDDKKREAGLDFQYFLYPSNSSDGDVELLMEQIARKDLHAIWWDCFEDYENCVGGVKDESGKNIYTLPNRKAKLHTYISSQQLSRNKRNKLGSGNWLFDDINYWDMSRHELLPLIEFFRANLE